MKPIKNSQANDFDTGDFIVAKWAVGNSRYSLHNRYIIEGVGWCKTHYNTDQPSMEFMCKDCLSGNLAYKARKFRTRKGVKTHKICAGCTSEINEWVKIRDPRLGDVNETHTQ